MKKGNNNKNNNNNNINDIYKKSLYISNNQK